MPLSPHTQLNLFRKSTQTTVVRPLGSILGNQYLFHDRKGRQFPPEHARRQSDDAYGRPEEAPLYRPAIPDLWRVVDALARIQTLLAEYPAGGDLAAFLPLVAEAATDRPLRARAAVASTFLAGLELGRGGALTLAQDVPFRELQLAGAPRASANESRLQRRPPDNGSTTSSRLTRRRYIARVRLSKRSASSHSGLDAVCAVADTLCRRCPPSIDRPSPLQRRSRGRPGEASF